MFLRRSFLTIWLCTALIFASAHMAQALNLVSDGQGAYYAADNQNFMLIDKRYMGPDHEMWNMVDLSTCEKGSWDGKQVVFAKVHFVMSTSDTASGPAFTFTFFSNGVYHTPGGTYQTISGSNAYRAVKVIFDRADGKSNNTGSAKQGNKLADDEIAIGGISPGATQEYVRNIYGEPNKASRSKDHDGDTWESWVYGDSFKLTWFVGPKGTYLHMMQSTDANGLATPRGIKVGSRASEVLEKYGEPFIKQSGQYWYKGDNDCDLVFGIENGIVNRIAAGWSY